MFMGLYMNKFVLLAFGLSLVVSSASASGDGALVSNDGESLHKFVERVSLAERTSSCGYISKAASSYRIRLVDCALKYSDAELVVYTAGGWMRLVFESVSASINIGGSHLEGRVLGELTASSAMSMDQFAASISDPISQYTKNTQHEVCAQICKSPQGDWGAIVTTVGSHVMCPITSGCPDGMSATGQGIHSHPTGSTYKINAADKALLLSGPFYRLGAKEARGHTDVFSEEDFKAGPGYMVTDKGRLMHQDGPKKVRTIGIDR